jgi:transcriptional regulator with XRE-family HTH domain
MEIRKIVGANVKRLRQEINLSQEAFADHCGLHRTYVSGVERGVRNPTIEVLAKIAKALRVPPSVLLEPPSRPSRLR